MTWESENAGGTVVDAINECITWLNETGREDCRMKFNGTEVVVYKHSYCYDVYEKWVLTRKLKEK